MVYPDKNLAAPDFNDRLVIDSASTGSTAAHEYAILYTVKDESTFTIKQRDDVLARIFNGMKAFARTAAIDPADDAFKTAMEAELKALVAENTSDDMALEVLIVN
jgi:hypothetical protein